MELLASRMNTIESRLEGLENKLPDAASLQKNDSTLLEAVSRTFVLHEQEKEERKKRSNNAVISGMMLDDAVSDSITISNFCENHLTVKPKILRTRRLNKNPNQSKTLICVTLSSAEAVDDLIQSSMLLRSSKDDGAKRVFINRDLTKEQAHQNYLRRCERREKVKGSVQSVPKLLSDGGSSQPFWI